MVKAVNSIHWLSGRFADRALEAEYQASVFRRHLRSNIAGVAIGIVFISLYIFSEFVDSHNPGQGVFVRVATVTIATCLLALMLHKKLRFHHDLITTAIFLLMGSMTNLNIWLQPTLENTFYLGLIQGYIMFTLLLRLNFTSILFIIVVTQVSFTAIVFSKHDIQNAILQSANTAVIAIICIAGSYLMQRFQREDFLKSETIEVQNEQLKELLEAEKKDNERKIAALNMLVHFIKTPLHQITGFSDILVDAMRDGPAGDTAENARYIKDATANLTKSVNGLLTYHRLDEAESQNDPEGGNLANAVEDLYELLPDGVSISKGEVRDASIFVDPGVLRAALNGFAEHYCDKRNDATQVELSTDADAHAPTLVIRDKAVVLSAAIYEDLVLPLTLITGYHGQSGAELPMALRTVARAVEIMGGDITHTALEDGNQYVITLPAEKDQVAAA